MMNSPAAVAQARKLAERVLADRGATTVEARIELLHQLVLGRSVTPAERRRIAEFVRTTPPAAAGKTPPAPTQGALPQAGPTPEVDAWSAVCQTLFATAEFRYLQ